MDFLILCSADFPINFSVIYILLIPALHLPDNGAGKASRADGTVDCRYVLLDYILKREKEFLVGRDSRDILDR